MRHHKRGKNDAAEPGGAEGWETYIKALPLRERKKARTKLAIQNEAIRLFTEQGYESTTIDEIAAAAEVAPRTVFRYFQTKEDLVLWDVLDEAQLDGLLHPRPGEPPVVTLVRVLATVVSTINSAEDEAISVRMRLMFDNPTLLATARSRIMSQVDSIGSILASQSGLPPDDAETRVLVAAVFGAWWQAGLEWVRHQGEPRFGGQVVTEPFATHHIVTHLAAQFATLAQAFPIPDTAATTEPTPSAPTSARP